MHMVRYGVISFFLGITIPSASIASDSLELGCTPPPGIQSLWERSGVNFFIIGETHGTREMPAAFGEIVCSAIANGKNVVVGLEFLERLQPSFQAYLESEDKDSDRALLLQAAFSSGVADGRKSAAMFQLMERLRKLKKASGKLLIMTYQRLVEYDPSEGQTPSERARANVLREASADQRDALIVVLTGNVHARRKPLKGDGRFPDFEPMAMHLPIKETLTLNFVHTGGSAWTCGSRSHDGSLECGSSERNPSVMGRGAERGLTMVHKVDPVYDGMVMIGKITASPPANSLHHRP